MEAFANALRQLPSIIAENGGYDSAQLVSELRALHATGRPTMGLDMYQGAVGDMALMGITESFDVKSHVLNQASEAAEMILRVDNILKVRRRLHIFGFYLLRIWFAAVLRSLDILVRIRISGSVPLTDGSGSDSGSYNFHQ